MSVLVLLLLASKATTTKTSKIKDRIAGVEYPHTYSIYAMLFIRIKECHSFGSNQTLD